MNRKRKSRRSGVDVSLGGDDQNTNGKAASTSKPTKIISFPQLPRLRYCVQCSSEYRLLWIASTIRDGRERRCMPCFVDELRGGRDG